MIGKKRKITFERELEEKTRLLELKTEEIKELKKEVRRLAALGEEQIILKNRKIKELEEKVKTSSTSNSSKPKSKMNATISAKNPKKREDR
ncbi:unnamed protein product [Rhizophagus irregularis]|nr:unnamed protein product [Rhizophagus irregularis]CAB4446044.1 unnamed protein product [Rhizophagus irregularis]